MEGFGDRALNETVQGIGALSAMLMIAGGVYLLAGIGASLVVCGVLLLTGIVTARARLQ